MEDERTYSKKSLEECSYRYLQQIAKSMSLPCNVKKVYLIELILAKKFSSASEVKSIVQRVKLERKQVAQIRKRCRKAKLKKAEIYSLSKGTQSPPITTTPKRPGKSLLHCSPDLQQTVIKYKPNKRLYPIPHRTYPSPKTQNGSDRVLRSFNLKKLNKNSGFMNINDTVVEMIKTQQRINPKETRVEIVSCEGNHPKFNVTAKCLVKRHKPSILTSGPLSAVKTYESRKLVPVCNGNTSPPAKRQRSISGIYPLVHEETTNRCGYLQSVGLRGRDGKMSRIQALVQKRSTYRENCDILNIRTPEINLQDVINCKIDAQNLASTNLMEFVLADTNINNNYLQLPCPSQSNLDNQENETQNSGHLNNKQNVTGRDVSDDMRSVYYHKKIRAEQMRCNRFASNSEQVVDQRLPNINEVFTKFKDVTQPLYVQVSNESERILNNPVNVPRNNTNTGMLENIYNIRSQFLINQPLLQVSTTSNTRCVYSTPILTSAVAVPTSTVVSSEQYSSSLVADSQYRNDSDENLPRLTELLGSPEQNTRRNDYVYNEELSTSASSMDTSQSQVLGACVTIPEMVEDALEIISQDGDYMERIEMDVRVQCILCSWAGPKIMLENHIRKEHSSQIDKQCKNEWNITFTLGSLVQCQFWLSQVIEYDSMLYVLSAKYEDPDCFMASLSTLTTQQTIHKFGSITLYNKVTGEPYLWEGFIEPLPSNLPYHNDLRCLKIELSRLDLLPNSANLKLLNRELVINAPNKVVVGQPELNNIHIILFIKLSD